MRYFKVLVAATVATLLLVVGVAGPAQAAEFSVCTTKLGSGCTTRSVQAVGGDVYYYMYAPPFGVCSFEIIDSNNGAVVKRASFWNHAAGTVGGLHSRYYAKLYSCPGLSEAHISG